MRLFTKILVTCLGSGYVLAAAAATNVYSLAYTQAPPANPLKGFMPYSGSYNTFPHSMEWNYLSLRSLMTGLANFTGRAWKRCLITPGTPAPRWVTQPPIP
jgi:hypothetical protein